MRVDRSDKRPARNCALGSAPALAARVRAALEAHGCVRTVSPEIAGMARTLAASKSTGSFLCIGAGAGEIGAWILDGMDLSSGMVALVQDEREAAVLARELDCDVRASVHLQDARTFLIDVSAHRFELIVDLVAGERTATVQLGLCLLRPGGFYLAAHAENLSDEALTRSAAGSDEKFARLEPDDFALTRFGDRSDRLIIARRVTQLPAKRRSRSRLR
jgi:predicted O-methyltransferase YrrM